MGLAEYRELWGDGHLTPEKPEVPAHAVTVWAFWSHLNAQRLPGFEQLSPLTSTEFVGWAALLGHDFSTTEIEWLIFMDGAWLKEVSEQRHKKSERDKRQAKEAKD